MCVSKGALITLPSWHLMAIPVAPQPAGSQQAVCWPMERPVQELSAFCSNTKHALQHAACCWYGMTRVGLLAECESASCGICSKTSKLQGRYLLASSIRP